MAFTMSVEPLAKEEVIEVLTPAVEEKTALVKQAESNVAEIMNADIATLSSRKEIQAMIENFGKETMERSTTKSKMLDIRMGELSESGAEGGVVVKSLSELNEQMAALDPSMIDFTKRGFLGKVLKPMRQYFQRYEKASHVIDSIMDRLEKGRKILVNDNTTLECEQQSIREMTLTLAKQIELATAMDESLEAAIQRARVEGVDEDKIKFVEEDVLFPLRQRLQDLAQMQAVNQQAYFAIEVIRKNNKELIRGVDRAKYTTVYALQTAVTVASGLAHQKLVFDCVNKLNTTTNDLIAGTARMLNEQGAAIQKQAMEASVSPETLRQAFRDTFDALDQIAEYKQDALPKMKATLMEFKEMAAEGEKRIQRMEAGYNVQ